MIDDANGDSNLSFVYQFAKIYLIIFVKELNLYRWTKSEKVVSGITVPQRD